MYRSLCVGASGRSERRRGKHLLAEKEAVTETRRRRRQFERVEQKFNEPQGINAAPPPTRNLAPHIAIKR